MTLRRLRSIVISGAVCPLAVAALALSCGDAGSDESSAAPEGRSPFATGNVSVAPQVEGRAAVPTPVPPPLPPAQTPTEPVPE